LMHCCPQVSGNKQHQFIHKTIILFLMCRFTVK
jgi:hypothetical protein